MSVGAMRILLVEDEPHTAGMLARGLREQAYAVDVAADGFAALEKAAVNQYDFILLASRGFIGAHPDADST